MCGRVARYQVIEHELSSQRSDLSSMTQAAHELKRERLEMAEERASFLKAEASERDRWAADQMKLMEVMSAQHKALHEQTVMLREERGSLNAVYEQVCLPLGPSCVSLTVSRVPPTRSPSGSPSPSLPLCRRPGAPRPRPP